MTGVNYGKDWMILGTPTHRQRSGIKKNSDFKKYSDYSDLKKQYLIYNQASEKVRCVFLS